MCEIWGGDPGGVSHSLSLRDYMGTIRPDFLGFAELLSELAVKTHTREQESPED